uniref:Uncharacterized protein n=1 Tax=Cacopsylla melanoneura TaxID=428564 RepID=A0A8D8LQC7_9HEMI
MNNTNLSNVLFEILYYYHPTKGRNFSRRQTDLLDLKNNSILKLFDLAGQTARALLHLMLHPHMRQKIVVSYSCIRTEGTFKRFLSGMTEYVSPDFDSVISAIVAHETHIFTFVGVRTRHGRTKFSMINDFINFVGLKSVTVFTQVEIRWRALCQNE